MKSILLKNGIKFIYKYKEGEISSFCAGFNAGALNEKNFKMGTAHVLEHMISKGTQSKSEADINHDLAELFGFENAMTNYPYTVYYGTCLSESLGKAIEFYSDILINPSFPEEGFQEEIDIICQELKEWMDDSLRACEAKLFKNCFSSKRISELIIGTEESVRCITLLDVKNFYDACYFPQNLVISVVSSLSFEETFNIFESYFGSWNKPKPFNFPMKESSEINKPGIYSAFKEDIQSSKIEYCFNCDMLRPSELSALKLFSLEFGEGADSMLFNLLRTEKGICYDISCSIEIGTGTKLFIIKLGTSHENIKSAINLIDGLIDDVKGQQLKFTQDKICKLIKRFKLQQSLKYEKSIQLAFGLTIHELMQLEWFSDLLMQDIKQSDILSTINKVLVNPSIQILTNNNYKE